MEIARKVMNEQTNERYAVNMVREFFTSIKTVNRNYNCYFSYTFKHKAESFFK